VSRLDGKFTASEEAPLDAAEILAALEAQASSGRDRQEAIARYLAAAEDWKDASQLLGGAFAEAPNATALRIEKGE
jgi:hypothetical protein